MCEQSKPRTEAELLHAAEHGLLEETHYLDLEQALDAGRSANKKVAADIAAFALDGGVIVIGVDEGEDGATPRLHPIDLTGLPERVETIAKTAVHEPVQITSTRAVWTKESRVQPPRPAAEVIFEEMIIGHIDLLTRLVARIADKYGFTGSWRFGVVITGLNHARALSLNDGWGPEGRPTLPRPTSARPRGVCST